MRPVIELGWRPIAPAMPDAQYVDRGARNLINDDVARTRYDEFARAGELADTS